MEDSDSETDMPLSSRKKVARKRKKEKKVPVKRIRKKRIKTYPTEKKVECSDCGMRFYWLSKLKDHQRSHTGEKPYECDVCHKRFSQTYSLKGHMLIHTDEKPYKCNFCPYACRDTSTLRKHHYRHMGLVQKYNCNMCSEVFTLKYVLKRHIAEVHLKMDVRTHKCDQCGKMYKTAMDVTKHVKLVHERASATTCPICNKYITNVWNLKSHMLSHISERPYMCDVAGCGKRYKDKSSLVKHSIIHQPNKHFKCSECDHSTTRLRRLQYHMLKVHQRAKLVECHHCRQKFYSKRYLILHIARKHDERRQRYICDSCGFVAKNKPGMVVHIKFGHSDTWNDRQCNLCRKSYKKHEYLKMHYKRTHNIAYKSFREKNIALGIKLNKVRIKTEPKDSDDEIKGMDQVIQGRCIKNGDKEIKKTTKKPYKNPVDLKLFKCDLCGRFFKKKPRLANHMLKVHERVKTVPCDQCGLKFYSKNYLITHMYKKHIRDKEYICDLCGYKTTYKPSIAVHVRYGHVEKTQCLMCKKKFKWLENLKFHYSETHKTSYSAAIARQKQQLERLQIKKEKLNNQDNQELFDAQKHELQDIPLTSDGTASLKGLIQSAGLRSVPENVFEDFCSANFVYVPEGVSRDKATGKRRKQDIGITDKTLEAKANSTIEKLLFEARKKKAFEQLESARKLYNERMENIFKHRKENTKIQTTTTTKNVTSQDSTIKPPKKPRTSSYKPSNITNKIQSTKTQKTQHSKAMKTLHSVTKVKHSKTHKKTDKTKIGSKIAKAISLKEPVIQLTDIAKITKTKTDKTQPFKTKNKKQQIIPKTECLEVPDIPPPQTPTTQITNKSKVGCSKISKRRYLDTAKSRPTKKIKDTTENQKDVDDNKCKSNKKKESSQHKNKYNLKTDDEHNTLEIDSVLESYENNSLNTENNDLDGKMSGNTSKVDKLEASNFDNKTAQFDSDTTYVSDLEDDDEIPDLTKNDRVDDRETLESLLEELEQLSAETAESTNVKQIYLEGQETTVDQILTEYLESDFEESDDNITNNKLPQHDDICHEITDKENVTSKINIEDVNNELESCINENNDFNLQKSSPEQLSITNSSNPVTDRLNSKADATKEIEYDHDYAKTEDTRQIELEFLQCNEMLKEKSSEDDHNTCNYQNNVIIDDSVTLLVVAQEDGKSDRRKQKLEIREDFPSPPKAQIPLPIKKKRIVKTLKKDVLYENFDSATPLVFEIPKTGERSRKQKLQNRDCAKNEEPLVFKARNKHKKSDNKNDKSDDRNGNKNGDKSDDRNDNKNGDKSDDINGNKNSDKCEKSQETNATEQSTENAFDDDNVSVKEENESDCEIDKNTQNDVNNTPELSFKYKVLVEEVLRTFNNPTDEEGLEIKDETNYEEIDDIVKENFHPLVEQNKVNCNKEVPIFEENCLPANILKDKTRNDLEIYKSDNYKDLVSEVLKSIGELVGVNAEANNDKVTEVTEPATNAIDQEILEAANLDDNIHQSQHKTSQKNIDISVSRDNNIPQNQTSQNNDNETSQKALNTNIDTKVTKELSIMRSNRKRKKNRKYYNDSDEIMDKNSNVSEENTFDSNMPHNIDGDISQESEDMVDKIKSRTRKSNRKYLNNYNDIIDNNSNVSDQNTFDSNVLPSIDCDNSQESKDMVDRIKSRIRKSNKKYLNDSNEIIDKSSNVGEQNTFDSNMLPNIDCDTSQESKDMVDRVKSRIRKSNKKYFNDSNEVIDKNANVSEQNTFDSNMLANIDCDTSQESKDMVDRIKSRIRKSSKKYFNDSNNHKNNIEENHNKKKLKPITEDNRNDKKESKVKDNNGFKNKDNSNENNEENSSSSNKNIDSESSSKNEDGNKKIEKVIFSTHQCYVCFKVFASKDKLIEHCKSHFGIDRQRSLKKCPLCDFTCTAGFSRHMKKVHDVSIKIPYARIQEELVGDDITYYFEVNDQNFKRIEVIPSVKNLNQRAMVKIDQEKREKAAKVIAKHKLVKKGNEWVVEKEEIKVDNVALPELDSNVNISDKISDKNDYFDNLKKLYHVSKKTGKKMLFPCQSCDKICQSLAALKLHNRKHEKNPAPFAPKIWKHKLENPNYTPPKVDSKIANDNKKNKSKHRLEKITKNNVDEVLEVNNKHAKPRPIKNKHKCAPELQEFYRNNIRGGDIEFWQFLKIFNKMDRDNINDFKDLEGNNEYGIVESGALH